MTKERVSRGDTEKEKCLRAPFCPPLAPMYVAKRA
jgi:hypothetical protein